MVGKVLIAIGLIALVTAPWFLSRPNRTRNDGIGSDGAGASDGDGYSHHHSGDHGGYDGGGHGDAGGDGGSH